MVWHVDAAVQGSYETARFWPGTKDGANDGHRDEPTTYLRCKDLTIVAKALHSDSFS